LKLETKDPKELQPNPWNTNVVSSENEKKLDVSMDRLGNFKPILVRTLEDGSLQILGGEHRRDSAMRSGEKTIPVLNLGVIGDTKAKEISLADNERYGEDDSEALEKLINSLETKDELSSFLPISDDEMDSFWSKAAINLDDLDLDEDDDLPIEKPIGVSAPTHRVVRFKVSVADAERMSDFIESIGKNNGFTTSDALTNAGDALIHALKELW